MFLTQSNTIKKIIIPIISIALIISIFMLSPLFAQSPDTPNQPKQFKVFMVLWRGVTAAEEGFMDYFSQRNINADFIIRDCKEDKTKLPAIIKEIKDTKPDLVYTFGTTITTKIAGTVAESTLDNKSGQFITGIPIVFNIVADPVGADLVPELSTSKRNLTGTSHMVPISAQVKAMKSVLNFHHLGVIFNPQERNSILCIEVLEKLADSDDFTLIKIPIPLDETQKPLEDISPDVIKPFINEKADLIYLPSDSFIISHSKFLVDLMNKSNIPTFSATEGPIYNAGALMGFISRYYNVGQFAGYKAEQILVQGKQPKDIPVETLKRFSFIISMKTAKKLEFYPPIAVLKFAEVITD